MAPGIGAFGGTEVRSIVKFDSKVFAAVGYWMDTEGDNPLLPGAQIIRLDSAGGTWHVDHELTELAPDGTKQFKTLASMESVVFTRTRAGKLLLNPQHMLVAGTWSSTPGLYAFTRRSGDPADWREALLSSDTKLPLARSCARSWCTAIA